MAQYLLSFPEILPESESLEDLQELRIRQTMAEAGVIHCNKLVPITDYGALNSTEAGL